MVDNAAQTIGPLLVWTLPAQGGSGSIAPLLTSNNVTFPWAWGWQREPLLQAAGNRFTRLPGAMGSGSFTILRSTRQEPGSAQLQRYNSGFVAGQYVAVTADFTSAAGGALDPTRVLWWGWISAISYRQVQGTVEGVGVASALEVGHLLDQQQVTGWQRVGTDPGYGESINSPPTANMADANAYIVGNAKLVASLGAAGGPGFAFARLPEDCGTSAANMWTRWRLLRHILFVCRPTGLPPISLVCADSSEAVGIEPTDITKIAGFLNDTATPEVYDLRNLTLKGAIDICVPQSRGFGWSLELVDTKQWQLVIYSHSPAPFVAGGVPINAGVYASSAPIDLTADALTADVQVVSDATSMPDEVVVEGSAIVFGATVAFADGNLKEGWKRGNGNQEDLYRKAAQGVSGYAGLAADVQKERNAMVRSSSGLRDVYTRYGLYAYTSGDIQVADVPGTGASSISPICPQVNWDGASVSLSAGANKTAAISRCPYLPTAALLRQIPWPEGVKGDGTDLRPPHVQFLPQFLKPRLFRYDSASAALPWIDFESRNGRPNYPPMSLDVDDRGAAFRVTLTSPEYLALNHWRDAAGGTTSPAVSDVSAEGGDIIPATAQDYSKLVATIALESDQRLSVSILRSGVANSAQVRRRLIIREPALQCWIMRKNSIIGLLPNGTPERVTGASAPFTSIGGDILIRNDYLAAQKRANMAASWIFRQRTSVRITRARPDLLPSYALLGYMITGLSEKSAAGTSPAVTMTVNTVVESISYDFTGAPRLEISTTVPGMIGFAPIAGTATGGGQVSVALGGTLGQVATSTQQAAMVTVQDTARVPVIVPRVAPSTSTVYTVAIIGGNVLSSGAQGIKSASVPSVPSAYDPAVDTSMVDGVGYGTLGINGVYGTTKVLVVNNGGGMTFNSFPLIVNDVILSSGTISIPVGAGPTSILAYTVG